jgi:RecA-family ATPase
MIAEYFAKRDLLIDFDAQPFDELLSTRSLIDAVLKEFGKQNGESDPVQRGIVEHDFKLCHAEIDRRNGETEKPKPPARKLIEIMKSIEEQETDFIWAKRIPRGKLTDFSGDPGVGKSTVASAIAAALSTGSALPFDREPEAPLRSLIISAEDGAADTLKPRLRRMNADMDLIAIPNRDLMPSQVTPQLIEQMLTEFPAALCIIDPIIAYATRKNTDKASDVRSILGPLTAIAGKHCTAIVLIRHLNKATQSKALYRGQGSIDFAAACRSAFVFAQDPSGRRLMAHAKSSLASLQPTLEFAINDDGSFSWGDETHETADEALGTGEPAKQREAQQLDGAKRFLETALSSGPMPNGEIKAKAEASGISNATLWRAKEALAIKASKERGSGEWWWRLP